MKKFICMALLFSIMIVFIQLRSEIIVNAQYKEIVLGKISNDKGYVGTEYIISDTYDEKLSGTGFLLCNYTRNKENNDKSRIIYYEIKRKKIKEYEYPIKIVPYLSNQRNCIVRKKIWNIYVK